MDGCGLKIPEPARLLDDETVAFAAALIDRSAVASHAEAALARPTGRRRCLPVRAVLAALLLLAIDDRPLHLTLVTELLFRRLTPASRALLGVTGTAPGRRGFLAACRRVRYCFHLTCSAADPSPLPKNRCLTPQDHRRLAADDPAGGQRRPGPDGELHKCAGRGQRPASPPAAPTASSPKTGPTRTATSGYPARPPAATPGSSARCARPPRPARRTRQDPRRSRGPAADLPPDRHHHRPRHRSPPPPGPPLRLTRLAGPLRHPAQHHRGPQRLHQRPRPPGPRPARPPPRPRHHRLRPVHRPAPHGRQPAQRSAPGEPLPPSSTPPQPPNAHGAATPASATTSQTPEHTKIPAPPPVTHSQPASHAQDARPPASPAIHHP